MSISAPTLPFDLACKGSFVDAPGVSSDSTSALGGDFSLSFATVLAGAAPVPQSPLGTPIVPLMPPLAGTMELGLAAEPVLPLETVSDADPASCAMGAECAVDDRGESGSAMPFFARHSLTPSRSAATPVVSGHRLGLEAQRRAADGVGPTQEVGLVNDVSQTDSRPKVVALVGESDAVSEPSDAEEPLPVSCLPVVVTPSVLPAWNAPVTPALASPVFCDNRVSADQEESGAAMNVPVESDDPAMPPTVVTAERSFGPRSEAGVAERSRGLDSDPALPAHASQPSAPALPVHSSAALKSRETESSVAEPAVTPRSDLPGALRKGERVAVNQQASTEPQGKGVAVARTSRASARAQEVAAVKSEERIESSSPSAASVKTVTAPPAELSTSPDQPATAASPAPARTESEPASVARPTGETPWMAVPRPLDPGLNRPGTPVAGASSDPVAIPPSISARALTRSARFSAPLIRTPQEPVPASSNGPTPSTNARAFVLPDAPEGVDVAFPVASGLDGESAWRRLPLAVQERLTFAAAAPVSESPSSTPLRTVPVPVQISVPVQVSVPVSVPVSTPVSVPPHSDSESLLSLEQAALDLVSEVTADGLPMVRTVEAGSTTSLRRAVVSDSMEKIAADVGDAFRDRVKGRAPNEQDSKRNLLNADHKDVAVSKFALGTETADRRALMHPDASSYRGPKVREESFSIPSGLSALTPGSLTESTIEPVETALGSSAAQSVRQIVDAADKLWATDRPSTHLKLKLDDVGVAVRVEYRDGEVTATFQTESPELRERLAAAWQAQVVTLSDHKPYRLAEPVFNTPSSSPFSGGSAGQEFSSGGENARQFAQSRQSETPVTYPHLSSSRSEPASAATADSRPPTPTATSARLHAFA